MKSIDPRDRQPRTAYDPIQWGWRFAPRLHPLVAPDVGIFDEPCICLKLNQQWASHFLGAIQALIEDDAWLGTETDVFSAQQEVEKFLAQFGDNMGCRTIFRQNPANDCQLQYSTDNGDTWDLAFDYSLCLNEGNEIANYYTSQYQSFQDIYNQFIENYVNNITDVKPDLGYDDGPDDEFRNKAICASLERLIDVFCEKAIEWYDESAGKIESIQSLIALTSLVTGIIGLAAGPGASVGLAALAEQALLWAAGLGIGSAVGSEFYDRLVNSQREDFEDDQAKEDLACCLYAELYGVNANKDTVLSAIQSCAGSLTGSAAKIASVLEITMAEDAAYAAFVEYLDYAFNLAKLDILPGECPCPDPDAPWCYRIPFLLVQGGFTGQGTWTLNTGWKPASFQDSAYRRQLSIGKSSIAAFTLVSITARYDYTKGTSDLGSTDGIRWQLNGSTVLNAPFSAMPSSVVDGDYTYAVQTENVTGMNFTLVTYRNASSNAYSGDCTLKYIEVEGLGDVPSFLTDNGYPCDDLCHLWDFAASANSPDWNIIRGTFSSGNGINNANNPTPVSGTYHSESEISLPLDNLTTIDGIALTYDLTKGALVNTGIASVAFYLFDASNNIIWQDILTHANDSNGTGKVRVLFPHIAANRLQILCRSAGHTTQSNVTSNPGVSRIKKVQIFYAGDETFSNGSAC